MSKKKKTKVFNSSEKELLMKHIIVYLVLIIHLVFNLVEIYAKADHATIDELTEITGNVSGVYKTVRFEKSIVHIHFVVDQKEYILYCYSNIKHDDALLEQIKGEEQVVLLVKQRKSFWDDSTIEVLDVRSNSRIYYDINEINIQRKIHCVLFTIVYSFIILFFTLIFFMYHLSHFERIHRNIKKQNKKYKKLIKRHH